MVDIANMLTLRYDPSCNSGTKLDDDNGGIRIISSSDISKLRQFANNDDNNIPSSKRLEAKIRQLIRTKIEDANPRCITVALSSGVDSNVIFSLVRSEFPHIKIECLNVTFDEDSSEAHYAEGVAQSGDAGFHEIHIENPLKDLPMFLSIIKEPRWNVYQYYFIEKAKHFSNVLFTGDGGDELFAGYTFRYRKFLENMNSNPCSLWQDMVHIYLLCHERDWVPDQEDMFAGTRVKFSWPSVYEVIKKYFDNNLDPLEQVLLADYHGKLMYDFIPTNEKFFKYFGIMGIAPLLSNEIIDISTKIPASLKYDFESDTGKIHLREIIKRNTNVMYSQGNNKRKIGFGMDLSKLWFKFGKEIVTSNLDKGRIFEDKIINRDWYNKSLAMISNQSNNNKNKNNSEIHRYISKMLQLLSLEIWYRLFVTSEINARYSI